MRLYRVDNGGIRKIKIIIQYVTTETDNVFESKLYLTAQTKMINNFLLYTCMFVYVCT